MGEGEFLLPFLFQKAGGFDVGGMKCNITSQSSSGTKIIKTKTIGDIFNINDFERARIKAIEDAKLNEALDESISMRHLEHEIIKDAKLIQVRVVNNEDGEVIRKIPPDKVVELVKKIRIKLQGKRLDLKV